MMDDPPKFEIVLATYNGAVYLDEQLNSIFKQLKSGRVLVHDDGSSDNTPVLLLNRAAQEGRLEVVDAPPVGGASANFSLLLQQTTAPYVFCADQDDIWLQDKLDRLLKSMRFYEEVYGEHTPLLVHSDLRVIDASGRELNSSFWRYQHLDPRWGNYFHLLLTQNVVTGCAMVVNRALLDRALPIPCEAVMHDWWLALVACAFGKVEWVETPMVLYRQHGRNEVGAKAFDFHFMLRRAVSGRSTLRSAQSKTATQAAAFAERFPDSPHAAQARLFAQLPQMSFWLRRQTIMRQKFFKVGVVRNLAWVGVV